MRGDIMLFGDKETIVFAGDSVTDAGRQGFEGQRFGGLGTGYVSAFDAMLAVAYPDKCFRVCNMGVGGDNILRLSARWNEVMELKPDHLFICIGINDVWHLYGAPERNWHDIDTFEEEYEKLIASSKDKVKTITLMTPYYMEPNKDDAVRAEMDRYGAIVKKLAAKYNLKCIDLQAAFDKFLKHKHSSFLAWDRVHPGPVAAHLIAREILRAIDFDGDFI